jgi:hypothetical protein
MKLFHVSGWDYLKEVSVGDCFTLKSGTQCAEGIGVYFSEGTPRFSAAEGAHNDIIATIVIDAELSDASWYRSKSFKARKPGKPRTWHTNGKNVLCIVKNIDEYKQIHCLYQFKK